MLADIFILGIPTAYWEHVLVSIQGPFDFWLLIGWYFALGMICHMIVTWPPQPGRKSPPPLPVPEFVPRPLLPSYEYYPIEPRPDVLKRYREESKPLDFQGFH